MFASDIQPSLLVRLVYSKGLIGLFSIALMGSWLSRLAYRATSSRATGISNSGSSVSETRTVSPIPSSSKVPIPTADLILPSSPAPASLHLNAKDNSCLLLAFLQ